MHGLVPSLSVLQARIYLYASDVDMRRSFDGLQAIVQANFERDVRLGDLFLFINKRRDRVKLLWWDGDGLAIFMKKHESEDTHSNTFTEVAPHRTFFGFIDETRSMD